MSAFSGYRSGINHRMRAERTQMAINVQEQYELGLQDLEAKNYELARQRFEYVIQLEPNYPGVTEKLAEVLFQLSITATPTFAPTPSFTPTPDLRGEEELFAQSQQHLLNQEWSAAIDTLLTLRKADPNYKAVLVDDMLYAALLNRGKDKILKEGDLEGGIYDLTLAERFGYLDNDSKGYLTWARLYITGASFWELDWGQVVYYFAQVAPALPNLRDGSGWTAIERYRLALVHYGDYLANRKEWCSAMRQYELALSMGADGNLQSAYNQALEKCQKPSTQPTSEPEASPEPTQEPSPTEEPPTETPPP